MDIIKDALMSFITVFLSDMLYMARSMFTVIAPSSLLSVLFLIFGHGMFPQWDLTYFKVFIIVWFAQVLIRTAIIGLPVEISFIPKLKADVDIKTEEPPTAA